MSTTTFQQIFRSLLRPVGIAASVAVVAVLVIYAVGSNVFDASMEVTIGDETSAVGAGVAAGFTVVIVVLGGVAAAVVTMFVTNSARVFTIIAGVIFVLMAFGPITAAEDTATAVTLLVMHVAVLVPVLALVIPALRQLPIAPDNATIGGIR